MTSYTFRSQPKPRAYSITPTADAAALIITFADGCKVKMYGSKGHAVYVASRNKTHAQHSRFEQYVEPSPEIGDPLPPKPPTVADYKLAAEGLRRAVWLVFDRWEQGDLAEAVRMLSGACGTFDAVRHALDNKCDEP